LNRPARGVDRRIDCGLRLLVCGIAYLLVAASAEKHDGFCQFATFFHHDAYLQEMGTV